MKNEIIYYMNKHGLDILGPRVLGIKIKDEILSLLNNSDVIIVFDFSGISNVSSGFAKELFGELYIILKDDFKNRIRFSIPDNQETIKSIIAKGIVSSAL